MKQSRKPYPDEFKQEAVRLLHEQLRMERDILKKLSASSRGCPIEGVFAKLRETV